MTKTFEDNDYLQQEEKASVIVSYRDLSIDKDKCCAYKDGELIELGAKEYKLFLFFMEHPEKVFNKRQIFKRCGMENTTMTIAQSWYIVFGLSFISIFSGMLIAKDRGTEPYLLTVKFRDATMKKKKNGNARINFQMIIIFL